MFLEGYVISINLTDENNVVDYSLFLINFTIDFYNWMVIWILYEWLPVFYFVCIFF